MLAQCCTARLRFQPRSGGEGRGALSHVSGPQGWGALRLLWVWASEICTSRSKELTPALSQPLGATLWSRAAACLSPKPLSLESFLTFDLPPVSKGNFVSSICLPLRLCHSEPLI